MSNGIPPSVEAKEKAEVKGGCVFADSLRNRFANHDGPLGAHCVGCEDHCKHAVPGDWNWDPAQVALLKASAASLPKEKGREVRG